MTAQPETTGRIGMGVRAAQLRGVLRGQIGAVRRISPGRQRTAGAWGAIQVSARGVSCANSGSRHDVSHL
jgi:hypothetical protein